MKALGVYRETTLEGKPAKDKRILELTAQELEENGFNVSLTYPTNLTTTSKYDLVFTMARGGEARRKLLEFESKGALVINSPKAVGLSLNREAVYKKLTETNIPIPATKTANVRQLHFHKPVVLKRTDKHEHWFIVRNEEQMNEALEFYRSEGLKKVIVQDFIVGSTIKFYVIGEKFFVQPIPKELVAVTHDIAMRAGKVVGLEIYGGDIITSNERTYLVDLNDWPSFSSINGYTQEEAAREIAAYLISRLKESRRWKNHVKN